MIVPRLARSVGKQVRFSSTSTASAPPSTLPIPPKIATPQSLQGPGGNSARMEEVVSFYKALPKGSVSGKKTGGPFGHPGNGKPVVVAIGTLLLVGYTLDYNMHLKYHKNRAH